MRRTIAIVSCLLVAIGAFAGLYAAGKRLQSEAKNRRVEIAMEYDDVLQLASSSGQSLPSVISSLKNAGLTSLAIPEDTLTSLQNDGYIHIFHSRRTTTVYAGSMELLKRIQHALIIRGYSLQKGGLVPNESGVQFAFSPNPGGDSKANTLFSVLNTNFDSIHLLGIGVNPHSVEAIKSMGLNVIARINNFPGANGSSMYQALMDVKREGIKTVIFQGLEVFGYRGQQKAAAEAFLRSGVQYGQVEFGKQRGDSQLSEELKGAYVRVHSVSDAEMGTMSPSDVIERFVRAARDRNIRICYLRMITWEGGDPVQENAKFISSICRQIARKGEMSFGSAHLFDPLKLPKFLFLLMGLGVAGGAMIGLMRLGPFSGKTLLMALIIMVLICVALPMFGLMGRKLDALLAALIFPTIACMRHDILERDFPSEELSAKDAGWKAIYTILEACAITSLGICLVVGFLASRIFMLKADQFSGIKLAIAAPVVFIAILAITGIPSLSGTLPNEWDKIKIRLKDFFGEPAKVGPLLLSLLALLLLALMIARTGNDPGVGVSGIELKFRALMDRFLPVRPRTKEFLFGHPLFILAIALWYRGRKKWALPLFVAGVVGQVSILNTFCHIHSPLHLSFIRDVAGLVFGVVIGLILFWLSEKIFPVTKSNDTSGKQEPRKRMVEGNG